MVQNKFINLELITEETERGLFSGELIFGGAYYSRGFGVSKWVGLNKKN